ncbi:hypothetical protein R6Q59_020249 [Mikania micrantha]
MLLSCCNHHKMLKIAILLIPLFLHSSSVLCQESLRVLTLHRDDLSYTDQIQTMGVAVDEDKLNEVSISILMAENWLRTHVLSYYPSSNINTIIVANDVLCNDGNIRNKEEIVKLIVDSMKNLHHSLTRWGLEREIKVSVSVSSNCFHKSYLKPVFGFLEEINSTYTINPTQFSYQVVRLVISELKSMNKMHVFRSETVNVALKQVKSTGRKLSFVDNLWSAASPPPPVVQFSPAPAVLPFPPENQPPVMAPASSVSHPYGFSLPPCNPYPHRHHAAPPVVSHAGGSPAAPPMVGKGGGTKSMAAPPMSGGEERLWCVAKPTVPSEKLQVALDYACGAGGADCGPIKPNGSCFSPDSMVAHASFAFNSYWQKNKKHGGMCGFEGTAMLISSDPSFLHCHFVLV